MIVDTDVLISHLKGVDAAREWLLAARSAGALAISAVTVTELRWNMRTAERRDVAALIEVLDVEPVTEAIARRAGDLGRAYRKSHSGIGLGDYLIAATALETSRPLATLNVRHFPMFAKLKAPFRI